MRARYPHTMFFFSSRVEHVDAQDLCRGEDILGQLAGLGTLFDHADFCLKPALEFPDNFTTPPNNETYLPPPNHEDD